MKLNFKYWKGNDWETIVSPMYAKYAAEWLGSGICYGIFSSLGSFSVNMNIMKGLAEWWNPDTCSFIFPWGEATFTIEDALILGGVTNLGEHFEEKLGPGDARDEGNLKTYISKIP